MFLLVVVHWKAPDEALVSSASVIGVQGDVIVMGRLHLPAGSADWRPQALALTAPLGCPAGISISQNRRRAIFTILALNKTLGNHYPPYSKLLTLLRI